MRIVYVTPFLRVPPDFGIGLRNYHLLKHLAHAHSLHLITYGDDDIPETARWLAERNITVSRLPYALPWGGLRSRGAAWRGLWRYPTDTFRRFAPAQLANHLAEHLGGNPASDIVVFDTPLTGQALLYRQFATPAAIVVTDVYASLLRRKLRTVGLRPGLLVHLADYLKTTYYEDRVLSHCWRLVTVSTADYVTLARRYSPSRVFLSPNGVDTDYFSAALTLRASGEKLLFVGSFEYDPNVDAFHYFCSEIFPLIQRRRPGVTFWAVGRNPPRSMQTVAAANPNIHVSGTVADVRPYYAEAAVVVVPLRLGGGVKLKLLEAFAMGVPVVATKVGAEGANCEPGTHLRVAIKSSDFAAEVLRLFDQPEEARLMAHAARHLVEAQYDWRLISRQFEQYLVDKARVGQ